MDPCSVCEDTIYHELGGMLFCVVCGTKYEGALEMELDLTNENSTSHLGIIKGKRKEWITVNKGPIKKEVNDWHELLQLVLQQQIKALIKLGANPQLKDVVFGIWAKYLEKNDVAFYDQKSKSTKSTKKKTGTKQKVREKNQTSSNSKECDTLENQGEIDLKYDTSLAFCYVGLIFTNPLTTVSDLIRWVKENKVPFLEGANCIPEGCIHELSVVHKNRFWNSSLNCLNSSSVLTNCRKILRVLEIQDLPEVSLVQMVKKFIILLDLPDEMHSLAAHLVESRGSQMCHKRIKLDHLPFLEATAVSHIIVMLKMLFGVDGKTERELSTCTRELMKLTKNKHQLFVFDDWMKCMNKRLRYNLISYVSLVHQNAAWNGNGLMTLDGVSWTDINDRAAKSAEQDWTTHISRATSMAQKLQSEDGLENSFRGNTSERQKLFGPLDTLGKIWKNRQTGDRTYLEDKNYVLESDFLGSVQQFKKSSIQHILYPKGFTNILDKFNLADVTLDELCDTPTDNEEIEPESKSFNPSLNQSTCVKHDSEEMLNGGNSELNSNKTANLDLMEMNRRILHLRGRNRHLMEMDSRRLCFTDRNHYSPRKCLKVVERSSVDKELKLSLQNFLVSNMLLTEVTNRKQFNLVCREIEVICDESHARYEMLQHCKGLSYGNLLNICCNLIHTEDHELHSFVVKTEQLLFGKKDIKA